MLLGEIEHRLDVGSEEDRWLLAWAVLKEFKSMFNGVNLDDFLNGGLDALATGPLDEAIFKAESRWMQASKRKTVGRKRVQAPPGERSKDVGKKLGRLLQSQSNNRAVARRFYSAIKLCRVFGGGRVEGWDFEGAWSKFLACLHELGVVIGFGFLKFLRLEIQF